MNLKALSFIKNFSYALTSNLVTLIISILVVLIVPKLIGVEEYGYWQLYLFYSSFVGFMHFGWNDGIYLRYGGIKYKELDKKLFFSQFYMLGALQLIMVLIVFFIPVGHNKGFVMHMTATCMLVVNLRGMLVYILQSTYKIKEYVQITIMDRVLYVSLIIIILLVGVRDYKLFIMADMIGKSISLFLAMLICREFIFRKTSDFYFSFKEAITNVRTGIKLMFSNIASMLIIGVVRFGIESSWAVTTFAKVSLTLSVSKLMMLFINALGIILYPLLRRTNEKRLPSIYHTMRDILMVVLFGVLIFYYPTQAILSLWLPEYAASLKYMAILFPMCLYEGKMALLINTYLKTLRQENLMLKINLISLVLSMTLTYITALWLKNLDLAIFSIIILLAFRCILAEFLLSRILGISVYKDMGLELFMVIIFIYTGWFIDTKITTLLYSLAYIIYLSIKRKEILDSLNDLKQILKVKTEYIPNHVKSKNIT